MLIDAPDANTALAWGDRIAQKYVAQLHDVPEVDWAAAGFASFIEADRSQFETTDAPRVKIGEYPDFGSWFHRDRI